MLNKTWTLYLFPTIMTFILVLMSSLAFAQKSQIKTPQPLPIDITPRVFIERCGDFEGLYGPMDYRSAHQDDKRIVEKYHFDMEYATFLQGKTSGRNRAGTGNIGGGFQYVLRSFPNHPTALFVMERLSTKLHTETPQNTDYPLECWYVRAFQIVPDDPVVRALYGIYLANRGRNEEALHNLKIAEAELQDNGNMQYNIGLIHFKLEKYELAQLNAMRASKSGFRLDGLKRLLKKAGHWNPQLQIPPSKNNESPDEPAPSVLDEDAKQ